jgi:putative hydrolase of the HAD superfamily
MDKTILVTSLFMDIGGVLLTDGWGHKFRKLAVKEFNLNIEEMENRHSMTFETFEIGKLTLEEYLNLVVFYQPRSFTQTQFQEFMFALSESYAKMIELISRLKAKYGLKILAVNNESRELNAHRIQKFRLNELVDSSISSCYVGLRKPDADIFRLALDIAQVTAEQVIYIDNTQMFVQIAEDIGIRSIWHTDYKSTREKLASFGLEIDP